MIIYIINAFLLFSFFTNFTINLNSVKFCKSLCYTLGKMGEVLNVRKAIMALLPLFILYKIRGYFLKQENRKFDEIDIESDEDRYQDEEEQANSVI